jgi:hypothetical protein
LRHRYFYQKGSCGQINVVPFGRAKLRDTATPSQDGKSKANTGGDAKMNHCSRVQNPLRDLCHDARSIASIAYEAFEPLLNMSTLATVASTISQLDMSGNVYSEVQVAIQAAMSI